MKKFIIDNTDIKLGENAQENWDITFNANPEHIWIHLTHYPSGHLVIEDHNPSFSTINRCAEICKQYSKCKNMKHIKYSETRCKNLLKGDKIGEVEFISHRKVKDNVII
tara:strand:- start:1248 stop:1574 length:327 start_codon:yes stop_codon:yes gene_type:complete